MHQTYEVEPFEVINDEIIEKVIKEGYENGLEVTHTGKVADYIPELSKYPQHDVGVCAMKSNGKVFAFGDHDKRFTIQSISKIPNLAFAFTKLGAREVFSHVMAEPTGDAFNSIIKLDTRADVPFNPMINAGAIQIISLLVNDYTFQEMLEFTRAICMDPDIDLNEAVYHSESETGYRNRAIAYLLKSKDVLMADPDKTLDAYFKLCSLNVTAKSLAGMGLVIACNGMDPIKGVRIIDAGYVKRLKSIMFTCGLYDYSGEYGLRVGIPSKSGVGGGISAAAKGPLGIGTYGPAVDSHGNSVAGLAAMEHISHRLRLHVFDYGDYSFNTEENSIE